MFASWKDARGRLADPRHWLRFGAGVVLGYVLAALAAAAVVALAIGWTWSAEGLSDGTNLLMPVVMLANLAPMAALIMLPSIVATSPVAAIACIWLRVGRAAATGLGSVLAVLAGWPITMHLFRFGWEDWPFALAAAAAGAAFAQPLWIWCIAPNLSPSASTAPRGRFTRAGAIGTTFVVVSALVASAFMGF